LSAKRTKVFLETVNAEYFGPRGLKMSLRKDEELANLLHLPWDIPVLGYECLLPSLPHIHRELTLSVNAGPLNLIPNHWEYEIAVCRLWDPL
jgi:hypothetical protein